MKETPIIKFSPILTTGYDVNTETAEGRRRLRDVAKECVNYGQRVQNSVFERDLDASQFLRVRHILEEIIDAGVDSCKIL